MPSSWRCTYTKNLSSHFGKYAKGFIWARWNVVQKQVFWFPLIHHILAVYSSLLWTGEAPPSNARWRYRHFKYRCLNVYVKPPNIKFAHLSSSYVVETMQMQGQVTTREMPFTCNRKSFKNPTNFSSTHVRVCVNSSQVKSSQFLFTLHSIFCTSS